MPTASLPILLQNALALFVPFLASHSVKYGRSGKRQKAMRSDRQNNMLAVVTAMLRGCSLQHDGIICHFSGLWVRPLSISEIATLAQICPKTVSRCIADLVDLGLLESKQIKRKNPKTGQFEVSIGIKKFTKKFWQVLGLWDMFKQSIDWAKRHCRRILLMPFKNIKLTRKTFKQAGDIAKSTLKMLSEYALRPQAHYPDIGTTFKTRK